MYADEAECLSYSDYKLEFIEKTWTQLLLNWMGESQSYAGSQTVTIISQLNKCVHPKAPINRLNLCSMVDVLKKYKQDIRADEIDDAILCSEVETFIKYKYPLLILRYNDLKEETKKVYLMTSIILFHCCVNSANGLVDGHICAHLSNTEQEMILKFCEKLMDMEITVNNIELAVKEACDLLKLDPRTFRPTDHSHAQKPSKQETELFESAELPLPSINSADAPPAEGLKQKQYASKFKPAASCNPSSISDMPISSFTSYATDVEPTEKIEYQYSEPCTSVEVTPLNSVLAGAKSPTGSLRQIITTTFKSVEYESFMPCSSNDRPSHISKTLSKSPTESIVKRYNTTIKSVEYESYVEKPAPEKSSHHPKAKSNYEYSESCSSNETFYDSEVFDDPPSETLKQRRNAKSKSKDMYKSYDSRSRLRSLSHPKAVDKLIAIEKKKKDAKSKTATYKSHGPHESHPVISIVNLAKTADEKLNSIKFKSSVTVLPSAVTIDASFSEVDYVANYGAKYDTEDKYGAKYDTEDKFGAKYDTDDKFGAKYDTEDKYGAEYDTEDKYSAKYDKEEKYGAKYDTEKPPYLAVSKGNFNVSRYVEKVRTVKSGSEQRCLSNCSCSYCNPYTPNCGDPGNSWNCNQNRGTSAAGVATHSSVFYFEPTNKREGDNNNWYDKKFWLLMAALLVVVIIASVLAIMLFIQNSGSFYKPNKKDGKVTSRKEDRSSAPQDVSFSFHRIFQHNSYTCKQGLCQKLFDPTSEYIYSSLSRCILLCMGPQLWPKPIGYTFFSKNLVVLATNRLEYKLQSVPSEAVHMFLAEAFKLFLGDLAKLERYTLDARKMNISKDSMIKKMYIQMDVDTDPDPRLRLDTEESYTIKVETIATQVVIKLHSASFCGIRHALETLSQLILLDQTTGNLITLSNIVIKDAPSYKYRGLMIDTGRNYIPVPDIMRTIDAMASVKLNTFHWRISDVTSFPLHLPAVPQLFEYGAYSRSQIYTKDDVKAVVRRAGIRGIRVLLEVAAPGPVGRAWSWISEATCPTKDQNFTCNNVLCLRLGMQETVFDILQIIYSEILEMTKVDDVFHLSDGVFSLFNCFNLMAEREGFLEKALERLKLSNKGFLPKLPIVWYTPHLTKDVDARTWDRLGVQLWEWHGNPSEQFLSRFKVIHSGKWDLSCELKKQRCRKYRTWQEMYNWKSWRNLEVFTIEGGEATLWTDLVDTGNLDYHLWPRAAVVAERLWSDIALNGTVSSHVYVRLDCQRWRMLLKSVQVQPIWPLYCSFSPGVCLEKIKNK